MLVIIQMPYLKYLRDYFLECGLQNHRVCNTGVTQTEYRQLTGTESRRRFWVELR